MEERTEEGEEEYIVMFPFMAHGHLIPFLSLATQLIRHKNSLKIIIATTQLNIHYLKSNIPLTSTTTANPNSNSNIIFAHLPFSSSLPQSTENLRPSQIAAFFHSSLSLQNPATDLLRSLAAARSGRKPLCVISDVFLGWAARLSPVHVTLSTGGAYGTAAYLSIWLNLPHLRSPAEEFSVVGFPDRCRFSLSQLHPYIRSADGTDDWSRFFKHVLSLSMESHAWLCSTVEELEPFGVEVLRKYLNSPVFCVGKLSLPSTKRVGKDYGMSLEDIMDWLSSQSTQSVLYVSFGSQNTIGVEEMMALARGLEVSGTPFVWAIRPPVGFDPKEELRIEWLPENFEERMRLSKRGLLVRDWAPQVDILGHEATGGFLSHCGWNSVMEALGEGVPLVGWSLAGEQAYNVKMLVEEIGVCVEVARGALCGVKPEDVRLAVEAVMGDGDLRRRAEEVADRLRVAAAEGGSVDRGIQEFLASVIAKRDEMGL